eukprot:gene4538-5768_t
MARSVIESNRCFFIHLGVAMQLQPFMLQVAFRYVSEQILASLDANGKDVDDGLSRGMPAVVVKDLLATVVQYAALVDANALCILWPSDFDNCHICVISGDSSNPLFTTFARKGRDKRTLRDIIIHCNGSHFTLLSPVEASAWMPNSQGFSILVGLLADARAAGLVVMENEVEPLGKSIMEILTEIK